tara:strand:- start:23403 stop:24851 length:1449 start_codon:yes stop_codon:yes gene_type:complete
MPHRAHSLRFKLAAWFVLVFFLIQTTLVGAIVYFRRGFIENSLDNAQTLSAEAMVDNVLAAEGEWTEGNIEALEPNGADFVLFAIRNEAGEVMASSGVTEIGTLPFSAWEVVPAGPVGGVHTKIGAERAETLTGNAQSLRFITLPFRHGDDLYYFQAATQDRTLERFLGPFLDLVVLGVPVGVIAALIAAWIIAGRAVAPIRQLSKAAQGVSPTSLSERIDVPSTDSEIKRLEEELNSALERLEVGYKAQDQFISNVSHELRTPVAVLLTQAQVTQLGERTLDKSYAFVKKAELQLKRFGKIVESFLVLARANPSGRLQPEPVSMIDIVLGCIQSCKEIAEQNQVRLIPSLGNTDAEDPEFPLRGDSELLQTMVENLVRNAISHSPPGGEVALEAHHLVDAIQFVVRDQGPGIPEEYRERIFERFVQVPKDSERRDGMGLGLAIAHGIVQLHGGTISVHNHEGAGCSFVVHLPMFDPDTAPS